jgi:hypothetical protein
MGHVFDYLGHCVTQVGSGRRLRETYLSHLQGPFSQHMGYEAVETIQLHRPRIQFRLVENAVTESCSYSPVEI